MNEGCFYNYQREVTAKEARDVLEIVGSNIIIV